MLQKEWPILIVDVEPDVLAVTRLALEDMIVNGVSIKLQAAGSKSALSRRLRDFRSTALARFAVALIERPCGDT